MGWTLLEVFGKIPPSIFKQSTNEDANSTIKKNGQKEATSS